MLSICEDKGSNDLNVLVQKIFKKMIIISALEKTEMNGVCT